MEIKLVNRELSAEAAEALINHILYYANSRAKKLDWHDEYDRGSACAFREVLHAIQRWGEQNGIVWRKNLEQWADACLQYPPEVTPKKFTSLRIKISRQRVTATALEHMINALFNHARNAAKEYELKSHYQQGVGQAFTEVLDSIHNWGIAEDAGLNFNLEQWAVKHLA